MEWTDKGYSVVLNVVGKSLEEAKKILSDFDVVVQGDGNIVTYQSIKAGKKIEKGSKIRILVK